MFKLLATLFILTSINAYSLGGENFPIVRERPIDTRADELLTVLASESWGELQCRNGFLHGLDESDSLSDSMVAYLKPRYWRGFKLQTYEKAVTHEAIITLGASNHYAWYKGGWENAKPWLDWEEYESYILYVIQAIDAYFPDHQPDFYDIWSEPDHSYFWRGTYEQLVETFARTINLIKTYKPEARVIGPSISWYRPDGYGEENIIELLIDLDTIYGIRLDAISWHENGGIPDYGPGRPEDVYLDEASIRTAVEAYFPPDYTPEYHVNEFGGGRVHLSPGWILGYLFWLDYVRIDFASHACWWILTGSPPDYDDYWCDCWAGLDGLFMRDGYTPQPVYWVHRAYAEMDGMTQMPIWTTSINTLMFAARDDSSETMRLLAGRYYDSTSTSVALEIEGYPYDHHMVEISLGRIPSFGQLHWDPPVAMPLPDGPVEAGTLVLPVDSGRVSFALEDFPAGDVYVMDICRYVVCGDADTSGEVDIDDVVYLINYIFAGGPAPDPVESGDADCSDGVDIDDVVYLIAYIFSGGNSPCDTNGDEVPDC